jgi:Tfp pilus assembly protein PilF
LEAERDFCLRSLRDLEAEHAAGDLENSDYETLRDSYVARAAAALRRLDGNESSAAENGASAAAANGAGDGASETADSADPGRAPSGRASRRALTGPWRKRVLLAAGVALVAAGAAWAVAASSATRLPGQEITGQAVGSVAIAQSLQAAEQAAARGDELSAVKDYQKVLNSDPNQPQALTGEGWLLAQTQQPALLQQGLKMLTAAEQADPTYAPAHVYRGITLLSEDDYSGAIPELQWYLAHDPDPQLAPRVRAALQQAQAQAAASKG